MFQVNNIKENDDFIIFFKIIEKKYIDNFIKYGQIYFGLLAEYRTMEETGQRNIGDSCEASLSKKVQIYIGNQNTGFEEIHGHKAGNNIIINAKQCAFCFYGVGLKKFKKESEAKFVLEIPLSLLEEFCKDKGGIENCAILMFCDDFIHKITDELKSKRLNYISKKVIYDDYDYIPQYDIHSNEYSLECCFHKRSKYEYQNEIRIAVLNNVNAPIKDLYVDVEPGQLQALELKEGYNFQCEVNVNVRETTGKICGVEFDILCFLNKNGK